MDVVRTEVETSLIDMAANSSVEGPSWFKDLQAKARDEFQNLGLPHRRVEEWKYTDLKSALKIVPAAATTSGDVSKAALDQALGEGLSSLDAHRLVLIDGKFDASLSGQDLPDGVSVQTLSDALATGEDWINELGQIGEGERDAVQAFNLAALQGGMAVHVADKCELEKPLFLIAVNSNEGTSAITSRLFFHIGQAAKVELIEHHVALKAEASTHANLVTEFKVANWADVRHVKLTEDTDQSLHLANVMANLGKESNYQFFQFTLNGGITRNQVYVRYDGDEAKADISGVALLSQKSHADLTLVMDHAAEGCESRELFKTVLDHKARAVFQGKVIVQPGAQKTDGEMMSNALLLSETAEFDSKPELEIYADDVLCGHGATTGQIDEELLFYLKARGVPEAEARALLIQAFVGEALELVENETVRDLLIAHVVKWYSEH